MYEIVKNSLTGKISCIARLVDKAYIPLDEANVDYQAYLEWAAKQNKETSPDAPLEA